MRVAERVLLAAFLIAAVDSSGLAQGQDRRAVTAFAGERGVEAEPHSLLSRAAALSIRNESLARALVELSRSSNVRIAFSPNFLPNTRRVDCLCLEVNVAEALDRILDSTGFGYLELSEQVVIAPEVRPTWREPVGVPATILYASAGLPLVATGRARPLMPARRSELDYGLSLAGSSVQTPTGSITGQVRDAQSAAPVDAAQVHIPALQLGALTQPNGRYLLMNVPAGTHVLRVERIGYRSESREVTVTAGQTLEASFDVTEDALLLDEIVVTGTAGQARRREVGNSIEQINLGQTMVGTAGTVESLLQGKALGMNVMLASGQVGDGARIRLRGNVSAALSNDPLIYVDGVRVRSEQYRTLNPVNLGQQYGTFATPTPLQDINPVDIERIEIIKGAAATTLYGTEAASGVIQIFTKRGRGAPTWEATIDQGVGIKNFHGVSKTLRGTSVKGFPMYRSQSGGTADYLYLDPWMQDAYRQKYTTSVRGGTETLSYYVSGSYQNDDDIFVTGFEKAYGLRGNLGVQLTEFLNVDWNTSYNTREIKNIGCGDNNLCARSSYGIQGWTKASLDSLVYRPDRRTEIDRLITGTTLRFQPMPNFSNRFTVGYDRADNTGRIVLPYGYRQRPGGYVSMNRNLEEIVTLDLASTYALNLASDLAADLSGGFQHIVTESRQYSGFGQDFPGPGEPTINSGATSLAREERQRVITGGVFGQALFKFRDRYFVTAGVRVDGNSAFGQDFGWQAYPKVSASYVLSDESFWPESWGDWKLRAAWGTAGRAPGAFDAARTWNPIPWGGQTSFNPRNLGNPELGPERTTEVELGFESAVLDGRLDVTFTWYHQTTSDALVSVSTAPSLGPWGSQVQNIGQLENRGLELGVLGTVIERSELSWDVGVDISTNYSKVLDLGGAPETASLAAGHPLPSIRGTKILNPEEIAAPDVIKNYRFGPNLPTLIVAPHMSFSLPLGIQVTARGEYQGGHYMNDGATQWAMIQGSLEQPACFDAYDLLAAGKSSELTAKERVWCTRKNFDRNAFVYPADFFKVREVTVRLPFTFAMPWASSATLGLSAQNIYRWVNKDFLAYDPDQRGGFSPNSFVNSLWQFPAPPKLFTASLRVSF